MHFAVDCGSDDICNSKLDISMSSDLQNNSFVLGSRNTFAIFLNISNEGEHAYQTEVRILISEPIVLASIPPECSESSIEMNGIEGAIEVTCDVGNPLERSVRFFNFLQFFIIASIINRRKIVFSTK